MTRSRFCPKCSAPIQEGRLCEDCTQTQLHYEPPLVQISEFSRVFEKGRWIHFDNLDLLLIKKVKEIIGQNYDVSIEPFEFIPRPKTKTIVTASSVIDGKKVTLPIRLSYRQCDFGQKQKTGYYEGILQIQNPHEQVLDFVQRDVERAGRKGVFITKIDETKQGIDLYFTNKNYLRIIGQKLIDRFGGTLDLNPQLFTHDHLASKDVFRLNALVKLPKFKKEDVISYHPNKARTKNAGIHVIKITSMGKIIKGVDLVSQAIVGFELRYVKDIRILKQHQTSIIQVQPEIAVLDPETFQPLTPLNETLHNTYSTDDIVTIVKTQFGPLIVE